MAANVYELDHLLPGRDMADPDALTVRGADLTFMHLRHTAITRLGEAGCPPHEIAAISGHSLKTVTDILERYLVRTAAIARVAFQRRLDAEAASAAEAEAVKQGEAG
jgi:integrase